MPRPTGLNRGQIKQIVDGHRGGNPHDTDPAISGLLTDIDNFDAEVNTKDAVFVATKNSIEETVATLQEEKANAHNEREFLKGAKAYAESKIVDRHYEIEDGG